MAVVGQGHFAQGAVLPAIDQLDDVELAALVSGSPHKLDELGAHYGVRTRCAYDELDELLATGRIDAVYVAVPTDRHAEISLIAARHGVHVLCEMPMAPTEAECTQMIRACEQRRVRLMVAYRLHFEAANLVAIEIVRGGEIGAARIFSSVLSMQVRDGQGRLEARRGAGPLYELGVYCVNAVRYLFRAEPIEVLATRLAGEDPRFAAIDQAYTVAMRFPGERLAQFTCSYGAHERSRYEVVGTKGGLVLDHAYDHDREMTLRVTGPHGEKVRTFPQRDQVAAEIEYFARCVRDGVDPEPSGWEGLADVRILQAIQSSTRFGRSVQIDPIARPRRPDLGQEIDIDRESMRPPLVDLDGRAK